MPRFSNPRELGTYVGGRVVEAEDGVEEGAQVGLENGRVEIDWRVGHRFSPLDKTEIANTFLTTVYGTCDEESREAFIAGFDDETEGSSSGGFLGLGRLFGR